MQIFLFIYLFYFILFLIYRYADFPFLFCSVRSLSSAGILPRAQQPFPGFPCQHLLLTAKAWTSSSSSSFCFCTAAPRPFPRQGTRGKEPEAPARPTRLENQISDKKAFLSLGTNMKISLVGYFWLYRSSRPGSRCVWREPRSCVMAGDAWG